MAKHFVPIKMTVVALLGLLAKNKYRMPIIKNK